ncbi:unannotated protein [freshwater metagenome]|uniref:Unannotated protein n=1 Tax=freshwater metagenome TaxID=449393 RepID=A0A6J6B8G3_9ZZZZ
MVTAPSAAAPTLHPVVLQTATPEAVALRPRLSRVLCMTQAQARTTSSFRRWHSVTTQLKPSVFKQECAPFTPPGIRRDYQQLRAIHLPIGRHCKQRQHQFQTPMNLAHKRSLIQPQQPRTRWVQLLIRNSSQETPHPLRRAIRSWTVQQLPRLLMGNPRSSPPSNSPFAKAIRSVSSFASTSHLR